MPIMPSRAPAASRSWRTISIFPISMPCAASCATKGFWPITIREQKPPLFEWMDVRSRVWQIQLLRALRFQSATASAGTALLNIIEGETDPRRRLAFLPTRTVLKGGGSFSEALARAAPDGRGDHGDHHRRRARGRSERRHSARHRTYRGKRQATTKPSWRR